MDLSHTPHTAHESKSPICIFNLSRGIKCGSCTTHMQFHLCHTWHHVPALPLEPRCLRYTVQVHSFHETHKASPSTTAKGIITAPLPSLARPHVDILKPTYQFSTELQALALHVVCSVGNLGLLPSPLAPQPITVCAMMVAVCSFSGGRFMGADGSFWWGNGSGCVGGWLLTVGVGSSLRWLTVAWLLLEDCL